MDASSYCYAPVIRELFQRMHTVHPECRLPRLLAVAGVSRDRSQTNQ